MPDPRKPRADATRAGDPQAANSARATVRTGETARAGDSAPASSGAFATLPQQFGRYRIERVLGKGQMGAVYLAQDIQLDRFVALKVARVSASGSSRLIKRMETEAKAAANVDHPLICKVFDFGEIEGIRYIALQYIEGEDLKSYFNRVGRQRPTEEAVRLCLQIAGALEAAHEKGVVHRDLKPENIMLNKKGEPVIMDFGLARRTIGASDAGLTQGMIIGSAAYMSPEQATGKTDEIDHRTDLYALGVMLFEMLTGEWPFTGNSMEVMGRKSVMEPPSPQSLNPGISDGLAAVCERMIAKKKEDRYATCAEVIEDLRDGPVSAPIPLETLVYDLSDLNNGEFDPTVSRPKRPKKRATMNPVPKRNLFSSSISWWHSQSSVARWSMIAIVGLIWVGIALGRFIDASGRARDAEQASALRPAPAPKEVVRHEVAINEPRPAVFPNNTAVANNAPVKIEAPPRVPQPPPVVQRKETVEPVQAAPVAAQPEPTLEASTVPESPAVVGGVPTDDTTKTSDLPSEDVDKVISSAAALVESAKQIKGKEGAAKFKEATMTLKKASNRFPDDIRPPFYLGLLYSGIGINDVEDAAIQFRKVLDRSPNHVPAMNNLALVSIRAHKYPIALNYFGKVASSSPRPFEVNQNLGRLLNQAKLLDLKKDELKRFTSLHTEAAAYRVDTGWMYMPLDGTDKARNEYKPFSRESKLEDPSCTICGGYAALPCKVCGRAGTVFQAATYVGSNSTPFGTFYSTTATTTSSTCRACNGTGRVDCPACRDGKDPALRPH